jgi:hypothetical protein
MLLDEASRAEGFDVPANCELIVERMLQQEERALAE